MATYTVQPGDTLGKIASKFYGNPNRYMEIANANGMTNSNQLRVGVALTIPGVGDVAPPAPQPAPVQQVAPPPPPQPTLVTQSTPAPSGGVVLTDALIKKIMPLATDANIDLYVPALNKVLPIHEINTPMRVAQFLAQIGHESGSLRYNKENLNYSASALRGVFGKYFPTEALANQYARQPEMIANKVYANRMDNGDEASGDGWKFRGRGLIQLTGKYNYTACGKAMGIDTIGHPDIMAEPTGAVSGATWFWNSNGLNALADQDDVKAITKRINGGYNGLEDREAYLARAKAALGIS